uniref:Uncharacterized protein n=1 Tax=viral metagenome TaxID=1070528 RepID=A0A6C0H7P5_9ZZZZ
MITGIKFIIKINKVNKVPKVPKVNKVNKVPKLITPKKHNMKNNNQDRNDIDKFLLKPRMKIQRAIYYKIDIFLIN